jgi:hypothetical protein
MAAAAFVIHLGFPAEECRAASTCSDVVIVCENGERDAAGRELASRLSRPVDYYIGEERPFDVTIIPASGAGARPDARTVVICGVAAPGTSVGRYIERLLGEQALARVRSEQLTIVVAGATESDLMATVQTRGAEIAGIIERSCIERLRRYFAERVDKALSRRLRETYGFSIDVPESYRLLSENSDPGGVQLLCDGPARLLGVFWIGWPRAPTLADSSRLFDARARYVWGQYDGDVMDSTLVSFRVARLGEYPAIEMSGYWSNSRSVAGGCYITFWVYEERQKLLWAVDLLVFAPGMPKSPLFRELLAIAETFRYE